MNRLVMVICCLGLASWSWAGNPVDESAELTEVSTAFELCDGPAWDGAGSLYIPDVKGNSLHRYWPKQNKFAKVLDGTRISATYYNHGQLYVSDNGNARISILSGKDLKTLAILDDSEKPQNRPNDLVVDNIGGVYVTLTRQSQVVYITADGEQSVAVEGLETPNGITLSPDGSTLYVASYIPKKIWAYDVTSPGKTTNGREFSAMDDGDAPGADGMCIDRAGNVYCAGATDVWIWSPSGELLTKIRTPTRPINCAFGDNDMRTLFITCFGGLYAQPMLVSGKPPHPPSMADLQPGNTNRPSTEIPKSIHAHLDIPYATYGDRKLITDIFVPVTDRKSHPAIVVVHGGGWVKGDKTKFRALALELAKRGYVTAAIEYRLAEEAPFPAAIHDCNAAVRFLKANANKYAIDRERIGAVGGSAGGHLVGLMATGWNVPELQGNGGWGDWTSRVKASIVMAGPMEITTGSVAERSRDPKIDSFSNTFIGSRIDDAPEQYALADAHLKISGDDPPILFMVGEHDNPERKQPSRKKLKAEGVWTDVKIYADGKHGCWNQLPWLTEMVGDMDTFFREHLGK
ncbi:MAG: SMP-30/gluconolactonase/LRE family protein [Planctomycetaceae bacterium]|nr:SMP-30/gluconolactonase/LRE family protein [Planctomycetaceae bacterium]